MRFTNFLAWNFVKSNDIVIELHETQMQLIDGIPTRTSLGEIVGKIYCCVSNSR